MTTTDRDQLIRAALRPPADLVVPADLGDRIHERIVETPQRRPGLVRLAGPFRRFLPEATLPRRPMVVWLTALLLLLLALLTVLGVASRLDPQAPLAMTNYHGRPAQDGVMPGPGPKGIPAILHEVELEGPMGNFSVPLVQEEVVYFADTRGQVSARDASDLREIWAAGGLADGAAAPVLLGSVLVVAGTDGTVTGLDAATGGVRWTTPVDVKIETPLAGSEDRILVGSVDESVHILASPDGQVVHTVDAGGPVRRSPAISDGIAYVAADNGVVTAIVIATGDVRWTLDLAADGRLFPDPEVSTPAYADGALFLARGPAGGSEPHEIVAIDVEAGTVRWRSPAPTAGRLFVGAVTDDRLVTVGEDGVIHRMDPATGDFSKLFENSAGMGALPTVVGETLYVSSYDGMIRAIDLATGVERWQIQVHGRPTMPVVVDGQVYVATDLGRAVVIGVRAS